MKQLLEELRAGMQEDTGGMPRLQKQEAVTAQTMLGQDHSLQCCFPQSSRQEGALNAGHSCQPFSVNVSGLSAPLPGEKLAKSQREGEGGEQT